MSLLTPQDVDQRPIRVAIVNDFPLVIAGTARALEEYSEQVVVVEYDSQTAVRLPVDVVLYDCFASVPEAVAIWPELLGVSSARLLMFTWHTEPELVAASLQAGAAGVVSKTATPSELVEAIQRVHRGEQIIPLHEGDVEPMFGRWPGDGLGLSARESEVLALICQGLSNKDISDMLFLGSNTVKTYIRTLYRKIEVESRSQAVIWGLANNFTPQRVRVQLK